MEKARRLINDGDQFMNKSAVLLGLLWLASSYRAYAEEPYRTEVQITGKESGPYRLSATVKPQKQPYKMDRSRDITNEDLSRILTPFVQLGGNPLDRQASEGDVKRALDDMDKSAESHHSTQPTTQSVDPHPHTTATIQDTVEELDPDVIETASYEELSVPDPDKQYRDLDAAINRARRDMQDALDRMNSARDEQARQQAIRDYEGAKQALQNATNLAP